MEKKQNPAFTGLLQTSEAEIKDRKTIAKIPLWYNSNQKENSPVLSSTFEIKGVKYRLVFWVNKPKEEKGEGGVFPPLPKKNDAIKKVCETIEKYYGIDTSSIEVTVRELMM